MKKVKWTAKGEKNINNGIQLQEVWSDTYTVTFGIGTVLIYSLGLSALSAPEIAHIVLIVQLGIMVILGLSYTIYIQFYVRRVWQKEDKRAMGAVDYSDPEFLEYLERVNTVYIEPLTRMDIAARKAHMSLFLAEKNCTQGSRVNLKEGFALMIMLISLVGCLMTMTMIDKSMSSILLIAAGIMLFHGVCCIANRHTFKTFSQEMAAELEQKEAP